jgi:hypothetical protein
MHQESCPDPYFTERYVVKTQPGDAMHSETSAYLQVLYIAASAQSVWQALTTPADIVRYHRCPLLKIKLHPWFNHLWL